MEIILSAIITAVIYSIQLLLGMKNYREDIRRDCDNKNQKQLLADTGLDEEEVSSRAIQYPGYLIRYTIGGFVITFHLLILIAFIFRLILCHYSALAWILEFVLPILILYALQSLITRYISSRLIANNNGINQRTPHQGTPHQDTHPQDTSDHRFTFRQNLKNILQYFVLVASKTFVLSDILSGRNKHCTFFVLDCFIGIASSIVRLVLALIFNILNMNRIDFHVFPKPLKTLGKASIQSVF